MGGRELSVALTTSDRTISVPGTDSRRPGSDAGRLAPSSVSAHKINNLRSEVVKSIPGGAKWRRYLIAQFVQTHPLRIPKG